MRGRAPRLRRRLGAVLALGVAGHGDARRGLARGRLWADRPPGRRRVCRRDRGIQASTARVAADRHVVVGGCSAGGGRGRAPRDRRDVRGGVRRRPTARHDRARRTLPACQRGVVRDARSPTPSSSGSRRSRSATRRPRRRRQRVEAMDAAERAGVDRRSATCGRRGAAGLRRGRRARRERRAELHRHALRRLHRAQASPSAASAGASCASSARSPTRRSAWRSSTSTAAS